MNVLDGRNFVGIVLECGKTEGDADTIIFKDGRFRSTACDRYEYGDGPYTASVAGDTAVTGLLISFMARRLPLHFDLSTLTLARRRAQGDR